MATCDKPVTKTGYTIVEITDFIANCFPNKRAPNINNPIVKPSIIKTVSIGRTGCNATATPATPPVNILLGSIKKETEHATTKFPSIIIIKSCILFLLICIPLLAYMIISFFLCFVFKNIACKKCTLSL